MIKKTNPESGNAFIFIVLGISLFAALAFTLSRGIDRGTSNLTEHEARMGAQKMLNFFNLTERAVQKLRQNGCSENDISFSNPADTDDFVADNDSPTAPVDNSCHVFDENGGKIIFNMDWADVQIPESLMAPNQDMHGNIKFIYDGANVLDLGTTAKEFAFELSYVDPQVCAQYNTLIGNTVDLTVTENTLANLGDENVALAGKSSSCYSRPGPPVFYKIYYVWAIH